MLSITISAFLPYRPKGSWALCSHQREDGGGAGAAAGSRCCVTVPLPGCADVRRAEVPSCCRAAEQLATVPLRCRRTAG